MDVDSYFSKKYSGLYKSRLSISKHKKEQKDFIESNRKEQRRATFNSKRNLQDAEAEVATENIPPQPNVEVAIKNIPPQLGKEDLRKQRLLKWKQDKEEVLKKSKKDVKKPFVVGIVHHKVNSPIFSGLKKPLSTRPTVTEKRVTRAETRLNKVVFNKPSSPKLAFPFSNYGVNPSSVFKFKAVDMSSKKKLTKPMSPLFIRREAAKKIQLRQYFCPQTKKDKTKESLSDEELATPLSPRLRVTRSRTQEQHQQVQILRQTEEKVVRPAVRKRFLERKKTEKKKSDEELATTASPPVRFTGKINRSETEVKNSRAVKIEAVQVLQQEEIAMGIDVKDVGVLPSNEVEENTSSSVEAPTADKPVEENNSPDVEALTADMPVEEVCLEENNSPGVEALTADTPVEEISHEEKAISVINELQTTPTSCGNIPFSPFVTVERGKRSARRSGLVKPTRQKISLRDVPAPDEPADGPTFQKTRLNDETSRLLMLAEDWEKITRLENLNQDIIDDIDLVVGQTRLLTGDKFQQFRTLIEQHEADHETIKVTLDDLNGFWEMMYIQVENVDKKYDRLKKMKSNNWVEPECVVTHKPKRTKPKKSVISTKSSVRDFIKGKKTSSAPTNLIKQVLTPISDKRRSSVSNSPAAFNALRHSLTAKAFGKTPIITVTPATPSTPKSCLKTKYIDRSIKKTVLFDNTVRMQDEKENTNTRRNKKPRNTPETEPFVTPRRSARLSMKNINDFQ